MIDAATRAKYRVTIGIECHVQLKTRTKLFSAADNDAREAPPNTLVNHIDFGLPGALPVLNKKAVELASKAAFALGTKPQRFSKFDRKHYFYPDLPMGYQITQYDEPIVLGGHVNIVVDGEPKTVRVTRAHLEADAGKSTHPAGTDYSLVDLNRAGTPLLEIVSEPDMHSAAEAKAYAHELHLLMRYADVSDANLYYGNMRFDVNVSVSQTEALGTRTETKNLNSFRSVERAVEYEIERQIGVLEDGGTVAQETRGWDDDKQVTFSQRSKEDAHDYRYMPDPDLPPVVLDEAYIDDIEADMPLLPKVYREKFAAMGIDTKTIEDIISDPGLATRIGRIYDSAGPDHAKRIAFWLMRPASEEDETTTGDEILSDDAAGARDDTNLVKLSQMVAENKLSSTAAKEVLNELLATGDDPEIIADRKNLLQVSDEEAILDIVKQVLADNPKAAGDVQAGEMKAIGFLVGQVMKLSQGKANPAMATELIKKQLGM
jgi:aspartyl-tRNA(Asn)/glutamyl-tRNA(Gln) amidotransferase subunit B